MKEKSSAAKIIGEALMVLISIIFVYPIVFMVMAAFRTRMDFALAPAGLPKTFTFDNIVEAFGRMNYITVFTNSTIVTGVSVVIIIIIGTMASYGISRA